MLPEPSTHGARSPALEHLREHAPAAEPVAHPVDRLAFLEEARPPVVVTAGPADRPPAGAHPLDGSNPSARASSSTSSSVIARWSRAGATPTPRRPVASRTSVASPHGKEDDPLRTMSLFSRQGSIRDDVREIRGRSLSPSEGRY